MPEVENPYLSARREWNERYGSYLAQARAWRLTAILALGTTVLAVLGVVYLGSQSRLVPYVVAVNNLGEALAVRRATEASPVDTRMVRAHLARWVSNVRSVYTDPTAERTILKEAYAAIHRQTAALPALNAYFQAHNPFERAQTETVSVRIQSVLPLGEHTWRVEWLETQTRREGGEHQQPYQATVTITVQPPREEALLLLNPLGIFVTAFHWAPRLS